MNLFKIGLATGGGHLAILLLQHVFQAIIESFLVRIGTIQHANIAVLALPNFKQVDLLPLASFRDEQLVNLKKVHQKEDLDKLF